MEALDDHPLVGDVRGVGSSMVSSWSPTSGPGRLRCQAQGWPAVLEECQKAGLIVRAIEDRIAFTPSADHHPRQQIDDMCGLFGKGWNAAWASLPR